MSKIFDRISKALSILQFVMLSGLHASDFKKDNDQDLSAESQVQITASTEFFEIIPINIGLKFFAFFLNVPEEILKSNDLCQRNVSSKPKVDDPILIEGKNKCNLDNAINFASINKVLNLYSKNLKILHVVRYKYFPNYADHFFLRVDGTSYADSLGGLRAKILSHHELRKSSVWRSIELSIADGFDNPAHSFFSPVISSYNPIINDLNSFYETSKNMDRDHQFIYDNFLHIEQVVNKANHTLVNSYIDDKDRLMLSTNDGDHKKHINLSNKITCFPITAVKMINEYLSNLGNFGLPSLEWFHEIKDCNDMPIVKLTLADNQLRYLPDELFDIAGIQELDISNNLLFHIPKSISRWSQSLTKLKLGNDIKKSSQITNDFKINSLKKILRDIMRSIADLHFLKDSKTNKFPILPQAIYGLHNLVELDISNVGLSKLHLNDLCTKLPALRLINISHNHGINNGMPEVFNYFRIRYLVKILNHDNFNYGFKYQPEELLSNQKFIIMPAYQFDNQFPTLVAQQEAIILLCYMMEKLLEQR